MGTEKSKVIRQVYNPFLPLNEYIPDGEPHVFDDRVYLYGSHDKEGGNSFCMLDYTVYSASVNDLKDWICEGIVYRASQDPHVTAKRKYMYAPDVVLGNDGRYYLYYALEGFQGPISVAVSDMPAGQYSYYGDLKNPDGSPFLHMILFDPGVINDDGVIRLYYGWALPVAHPKNRFIKALIIRIMQVLFAKSKKEILAEPDLGMGANMVVLGDDMLTVTTKPRRIAPSQMMEEGTGFEGHAFREGSSIRKIGNTYYFIYSSSLNHELCYATSQFPNRDFTYRGVIISNGDIGFRGRAEKDRLNTTGNNHGSIERIDGKWYVFYHRHTHKSAFSRQACAEPIEILEDGSIPQVEMTSCGLNGGPLLACGEYPAVIACNLTNGRMPHFSNFKKNKRAPNVNHEGDIRFIKDIMNNTLIGFKYFDFSGQTNLLVKYRGGGGVLEIMTEAWGKSLTSIALPQANDWSDSLAASIVVDGKRPLYLLFRGKGNIDLLSFTFRNV